MYPSDDDVAYVEWLISQEEQADKDFRAAAAELDRLPAWRVLRRMHLFRIADEALDRAAGARREAWRLTQDWECTEDG